MAGKVSSRALIIKPDSPDIESGVSQEFEPQGDAHFPLVSRIMASMTSWQGCCSFWQVVFVGLVMLGAFFFSFGHIADDIWLIVDALFLMLLASYCAAFLGGDPCLFDAMRENVNKTHIENDRLNESNKALEAKLRGLDGIAQSLDSVEQQMAGQTETAEDLLLELEQLSALQRVSVALEHFFNTDRDHNGNISGGREAGAFVRTFGFVKDLVPNFDFERLESAIQKHGLSFSRYCRLLGAMVAAQPSELRTDLEELCEELEVDDEPDSTPAKKTRGLVSPKLAAAGSREKSESESESDSDSEKDEVFQPWVIGPVRIYGIEHATFAVLLIMALLLCIANFLADYANATIICSLLCVALAGYLTAFGEMIVIVRALKVEVGRFHAGNDKLLKNVDALGSQVAKLNRLNIGFKQLQEQFGGVVSKAQQLLKKNREDTSQSAADVLMNLLMLADENEDNMIDENESTAFFSQLEQAFSHIPDFDIEVIKKGTVASDGCIHMEELPGLVKEILKTQQLK